MRRSDISSIVGGFITFIIFLTSIALLYYFMDASTKKMLDIFETKVLFYEKMTNTMIEILNNQTSAINGTIEIKNIGRTSLNLQCFKLYIDGKLVPFKYSINELYKDGLLNPGETATLTFIGSFTSGWKNIRIVSCEGEPFESLIYLS